jgi:hypothetical protein
VDKPLLDKGGGTCIARLMSYHVGLSGELGRWLAVLLSSNLCKETKKRNPRLEQRFSEPTIIGREGLRPIPRQTPDDILFTRQSQCGIKPTHPIEDRPIDLSLDVFKPVPQRLATKSPVSPTVKPERSSMMGRG